MEGVWELDRDGSGTTGGPAGAGVAAYREGRLEFSNGFPLEDATNQQAEILAAALALLRIPERSRVVLHSDSKYPSSTPCTRPPRGGRTDGRRALGRGSRRRHRALDKLLLDIVARHRERRGCGWTLARGTPVSRAT